MTYFILFLFICFFNFQTFWEFLRQFHAKLPENSHPSEFWLVWVSGQGLGFPWGWGG